MNLIIFSGFLGSGKTSAILNIAVHLVTGRKPGKPDLVIIENEIGETGIDEKILKSGGLAVQELFAGCVCCQLTSDLVIMLEEIRRTYSPRWVIVEATGLAYPGKILDTLIKYGKGIESINTITLVDAERWDELIDVTPVLIENQVKDANIILINKIDLIDNYKLNRVRNAVGSLNPAALVYNVNANKKDEIVWEKLVQLNERVS